MSLYSYRIFQSVVQHESFARAAQALHLTPSAVSHAISDLETEFGVTLLVRGKKSVSLTEPGRQIYQYVRDILITSELLDRKVAQIKGAQSGPVRLGMIESAAKNWLSGTLARYRAQCPGVEVSVQVSGYSALIRGVLERTLDLAVVSHTSVLENTRTPLQFIPLCEDRIVCVVPRASALAEREFLTAAELEGQPVLLPEGGDEADVETYLREQGVRPQIAGRSASCAALLELVECGLGVAVTPELSVTSFGYDAAVLPLAPFGARTLGLITQDPKFLSPAGSVMASCIQNQLF